MCCFFLLRAALCPSGGAETDPDAGGGTRIGEVSGKP